MHILLNNFYENSNISLIISKSNQINTKIIFIFNFYK